MVRWLVRRDGKRFGPFEDADMPTLAASGRLAETDEVRREGTKEWGRPAASWFRDPPPAGWDAVVKQGASPPPRQATAAAASVSYTGIGCATAGGVFAGMLALWVAMSILSEVTRIHPLAPLGVHLREGLKRPEGIRIPNGD